MSIKKSTSLFSDKMKGASVTNNVNTEHSTVGSLSSIQAMFSKIMDSQKLQKEKLNSVPSRVDQLYNVDEVIKEYNDNYDDCMDSENYQYDSQKL